MFLFTSNYIGLGTLSVFFNQAVILSTVLDQDSIVIMTFTLCFIFCNFSGLCNVTSWQRYFYPQIPTSLNLLTKNSAEMLTRITKILYKFYRLCRNLFVKFALQMHTNTPFEACLSRGQLPYRNSHQRRLVDQTQQKAG